MRSAHHSIQGIADSPQNPPRGGALTRRGLLGMLGAGLLWPFGHKLQGLSMPPFRIRTITAGLRLEQAGDLARVEAAIGFLERARASFEESGYEVQTIRVATQPVAAWLPEWKAPASLDAIQAIDELARGRGVSLSIGPVLTGDEHDPELARWAARLARETRNISFSVHVASAARGIHYGSARSAAAAMSAIAHETPGGEGNFRFAATAFCPPGTPFFPAAYHAGPDCFALGLESPRLLGEAFRSGDPLPAARAKIVSALNAALQPVEAAAEKVAEETGRSYLGIDTSPAPGLDSSIGRVIESLTGAPFGAPSTLAACAVLTDALQDLAVKRCGYCGLMLPVLEDTVLARRAVEGRYGVSDLLLYSSVCGTGLDVVPLPGDVSVDALAAVIGDVAALAAKYRKPLSARLFPVPGKRVGEAVSFDNPYLTDSVIMELE